jgi:lactoylglutathione lyase
MPPMTVPLQSHTTTAGSTMKEIVRINHIGLRVTDLEIAREFYEKLGFEFIAGPIGPEPVAIMEHPSGININFILNASKNQIVNMLMDIPEKYTGYTHVALEVTDMQSTQAYLESIDYEITEGPIVTSEGASFIFIRDPDQNVIEFHLPAQ